jgi:hydrogenase nickel incorporation protein HypA/HybF
MEVLDIVQREASAHGASAVTRVRLRIGDLSGVETDSLVFCFDAVKAEQTMTAGAQLIIEKIPVRVRCAPCEGEFEETSPVITCPSCGGFETQLLEGEELEVGEIEVE